MIDDNTGNSLAHEKQTVDIERILIRSLKLVSYDDKHSHVHFKACI